MKSIIEIDYSNNGQDETPVSPSNNPKSSYVSTKLATANAMLEKYGLPDIKALLAQKAAKKPVRRKRKRKIKSA